MKKLMYLIVVLVVLSYPVSAIAEGSRMKLTDGHKQGKVIHSLHIQSKDGHSEIVVHIGQNLLTIDLGSLMNIGCDSGYYTDIHFKFDLEKAFRVPLYCSESITNFVYSFEPYFVKKLVYHLKKYYVLRVFIPNSFEVVEFDLIGFIYLYNSTNF